MRGLRDVTLVWLDPLPNPPFFTKPKKKQKKKLNMLIFFAIFLLLPFFIRDFSGHLKSSWVTMILLVFFGPSAVNGYHVKLIFPWI